MKVAILGMGEMGRALIFALKKLEYDVTGLDISEEVLQDSSLKRFKQDSDLINYDVVFSCLPYHVNLRIAKFCLGNNIKYFDLGGHLETSDKIRGWAPHYWGMTDLGLAPGLVNIIGESISDGPVLEMYCGGIPQDENVNPLKYSLTWSVDGLINEYTDSCIIKEGGIKSVPALTGYKSVYHDDNLYESFYTSGALNYSIDRLSDVQNIYYRTIRHIGHLDLIKWLIKNLSVEELKNTLVKGCPKSPDLVLIKCVTAKEVREHTIWPMYGFSAMQVATGFSAACIMHHSLKREVSNYGDIEIAELTEDLKFLGVTL